MPAGLVEVFSSRRARIDAELADLVAAGHPDGAGLRASVQHDTRAPKRAHADAEIRAAHHAQLTAAGWTVDQLLASAGLGRHRPAPLAHADIEDLVGAVVGAAGPSGRTATFSAREITRAVAGRVGDRADAATIDRLTARVLADPRLVQVDVAAVRRRREPEPVYTTYDLLEVEDSLLALCRAGRTTHSGHPHRLIGPGHLDTALAPFNAAARRPGADHAVRAAPNGADSATAPDTRADGADAFVLSVEQVDAVHRLLASTDLVRVLVGPAGSGKTEAMRLVVRILTDAGRRVVAGAHGGRQTEQLTARLGVEGRVVAGWLTLLDTTPDPRQVWPAGTVLILDEATHVDTRDAERLIRYATLTGTVVIAVGDPAQLGSIGPGGWFTHLATTLPEHELVTLSAVHRQTGPGMAGVRAALAGLRAGAPPQIRAALARLADDNRIRLSDTRPAMLAAVVTDWHTDRTNAARVDGRAGGASNGATDAPEPVEEDGDGSAGEGGVGDLPRMTAADHTTVEWLNRAAQLRLIATGQLDPTAFVEVAGRRFHVGDEVITLTQAGHTLIPTGRPPSAYLRTGTIGVVTALHADPTRPDAQAVTVTFPGKGQVQVGWEYLTHRFPDGRDGGLALAYAITAHKAQGTTMTSARPVITDRTSRPGLYVMLSRAATDLTAYLIDSSTLHGGLDDEDWLPILDADTDTLDRLGASLEASRPDRLAAVAHPDARAVADLRRTHTLAELTALRRRIPPTSAALGGVARPDTEGGATGAESRADGATTATTGATRDPAVLARAERAAEAAVASAALAEPPPALVAKIGRRPAAGPGRRVWEDAVTTLAIYQARHAPHQAAGDPGPEPALGPDDDTTDRWNARQAQATVLARSWATGLHPSGISPTTGPALDRATTAIHALLPTVSTPADLARTLTSIDPAGIHDGLAVLDYRLGRLCAAARVDPGLYREPPPASAHHDWHHARRSLDRAETHHLAAQPTPLLADALSDQCDPAPAAERRVQLLTAALNLQADDAVANAATEPPGYLTDLLGSRRAQPDQWDAAAHAIEYYRHHHLALPHGTPAAPDDAPASHRALGPPPADPDLHQRWYVAAAPDLEPAPEPAEPAFSFDL